MKILYIIYSDNNKAIFNLDKFTFFSDNTSLGYSHDKFCVYVSTGSFEEGDIYTIARFDSKSEKDLFMQKIISFLEDDQKILLINLYDNHQEK